LTRAPGGRLFSVVASHVWGITATSNASPRRCATVREIPSREMDPFSTT
jgi:hypothetical protein